MLDFFQAIMTYLEMLWTTIINLVSMIISLLTAVLGAVIIPQTAMLYVFGPLSASILAVMAIAIVKLVIGRDNV